MINESEKHEIHVPIHTFCCCQLLRLCWTGPIGGTQLLGQVQYATVPQTWLAWFCLRLLYYWNVHKIDDRVSDVGHDVLSILGRNAALCLATDRLGGQLPSRPRHFSFGSTNRLRGLSLDSYNVTFLTPNVTCWAIRWQDLLLLLLLLSQYSHSCVVVFCVNIYTAEILWSSLSTGETLDSVEDFLLQLWS